MLKYTMPVLLFAMYVVHVNGFVFPEEFSSKSRSDVGYGEDHDYSDNSDSYDYHSLSHENNDDEHNEYGNDYDSSPAFDDRRGRRDGPRRPASYGGGTSQSQANAQSSGIGSAANAQSGSQHFNDFSQSYAHAESQANSVPASFYPSGPSDHHLGGASAASAASSIVNGFPAASASAAAASSGGASSASASSSASGGCRDTPGQFAPWFIHSRISGDEANVETNDGPTTVIANDDPTDASANDDKIVFSEEQ